MVSNVGQYDDVPGESTLDQIPEEVSDAEYDRLYDEIVDNYYEISP